MAIFRSSQRWHKKKGLKQSDFELHEGQSRMMNEREKILTNLIERITRNAKNHKMYVLIVIYILHVVLFCVFFCLARFLVFCLYVFDSN